MKQQALPFIFLFLSPLPRGNMALPRKGQIDTFILFTQGCAPPPPNFHSSRWNLVSRRVKTGTSHL